jgi:uncharacterized protein YqcC (DUF446 family)
MTEWEEEIRVRVDAIETEMKATGLWDVPEPTPEAFEQMGAFGAGTMAFSQWLRYVFVPTVRERLADGGPWPSTSMVGAQAVREFDGLPEAAPLCHRLSDFDALFPGP